LRSDAREEIVMRTVMRGLLAWLVLLALMVGNGFVRVLWLEPRLDSESARQVASLLGVAIVGAVAWWFVRDRRLPAPTLWAVGGLWFALTLGFEFGFGRLASGASWGDLLADYDLTRGRLWPLVLAAVLAGPRVMAARRDG
jgi:hypothetical protein